MNPCVELEWRDWGAESVVLEVGPGRVHLLDPLSAAVLGCHDAGPQPADQVFAELATDLGAGGDPDVLRLLEQAHRRFVEMGWLLPAGPA